MWGHFSSLILPCTQASIQKLLHNADAISVHKQTFRHSQAKGDLFRYRNGKEKSSITSSSGELAPIPL